MLDYIYAFDDAYEDPRQEIEHLSAMIDSLVRKRRILQSQALNFGISTPPHIQMELAEVRATIRAFNDRRNILNSLLASNQTEGTFILLYEQEPDLLLTMHSILTKEGGTVGLMAFDHHFNVLIAAHQRQAKLIIIKDVVRGEDQVGFAVALQLSLPQSQVVVVMQGNDLEGVIDIEETGVIALFPPISEEKLLPLVKAIL